MVDAWDLGIAAERQAQKQSFRLCLSAYHSVKRCQSCSREGFGRYAYPRLHSAKTGSAKALAWTPRTLSVIRNQVFSKVHPHSRTLTTAL